MSKYSILAQAKYYKEQGINEGILLVLSLIDAAIWNSSNDLELSDDQRSKLCTCIHNEIDSLIHSFDTTKPKSEIDEDAEYIVNKSKQCKNSMINKDLYNLLKRLYS